MPTPAKPRCMVKKGAAAAARKATTTVTLIQGRAITRPAARAHKTLSSALGHLRPAGEEDGLARGPPRHGDGVHFLPTAAALLAEALHYEKGVVDPHGQTDHRYHVLDYSVHWEQAADQRRRTERDDDREPGEEKRQ